MKKKYRKICRTKFKCAQTRKMRLEAQLREVTDLIIELEPHIAKFHDDELREKCEAKLARQVEKKKLKEERKEACENV